MQIAVNDLIGDPLEERAKENLPSVIYNQWGPSSGSAGEKLLKDFRISNTKDKEKGAKGGGNGKDLLPPN